MTTEVLREMNNKLAAYNAFIEHAIGGKAEQVILGRNVVTDITIDITKLMEIAGNEWSEVVRRYKENKMCAGTRE